MQIGIDIAGELAKAIRDPRVQDALCDAMEGNPRFARTVRGLLVQAAAPQLESTKEIAARLGVQLETFRSWYKGHEELEQLAQDVDGKLMWPVEQVKAWWEEHAAPKQRRKKP